MTAKVNVLFTDGGSVVCRLTAVLTADAAVEVSPDSVVVCEDWSVATSVDPRSAAVDESTPEPATSTTVNCDCDAAGAVNAM